MANTPEQNAYLKAWRLANKDRANAAIEAWRAANPDKIKEYGRRHREKTREYMKAYAAKWYQLNKTKKKAQHSAWSSANKDKCAGYCAKRYATQLRATPVWANAEQIATIYKKAAELTASTGIPHDVDHIVPLKSHLVCGLHVEINLQILTKSENSSKFNRRWPDMP